jgi:hypothetical protein
VGSSEWITVDLSFNLNISCICNKQDTYSYSLEFLHARIPPYLEADVIELPEVVWVFCSHATLLKQFYLWNSSVLKLVFDTVIVRQKRCKDWMAQILRVDHAQLWGGQIAYDGCQCLAVICVFQV